MAPSNTSTSGTEPQGNIGSHQLPSLITQIKDNSSSVLRNQLTEMFGILDDALFENAQKAKNNNEQNLLFEAMRGLRVHRDSLIDCFFDEYSLFFQELAENKQKQQATENPEDDRDSIGLMPNEELEKEVAITNMVTYARNNFQEELYFLNCRFDCLMPRCKVDESNNPLDPAQMCHAFLQASKILDFELQTLLIVFKYFDQRVVKNLSKLYNAANQLLKDSGVLPKIATPIQKNDSSQHEQSEQASVNKGLAKLTSEQQAELTFAGLSSMLQIMRQRGAELPIENMIKTPATGVALPQADLISSLSDIQRPSANDLSDESHRMAVDIRSAVQAILAEKAQNGQEVKLNQLDEDVINLVSWLFDIILEDETVHAEMRALISRLQIPILKLALRDKSFFSHSKHPAHRLINEIARTSIGWSKSDKASQDALYIVIKEVVNNILEHYHGNDAVFGESLSKLEEFLEKEQKNATKIEQRTSRQEQAKAKQGRIKDLCRRILLDRLQGKQLPPEITDFIARHWQKVLVISHLKYGKDSNEWLNSLQCLDDLVWSVQPHQDDKSKQRFQRILPELQKGIRQGLALVASNEAEAESIFKRLEKIHSDISKDRFEEIDYKPLQPDHLAELKKTEDPENKPWKEMSAVERQQVQYKSLMFDYIKKAEAMPIGSWVIIERPEKGDTQRCKLAAKINDNDTFVFVNRFGFKVLQKKRKEFAYAMQCKRIRPIETGLLFDRALDKISNNLRKLASEPEAAN